MVAALKRQAEELQYYAKLHRDGPLGGPYTGPIAVAPPSASAAVEGKPAKTVEHVQAPTINVMPRKSPALVAAPAKKPRLDAPKKPTPDGHQQPGVRTLTTAVASSQPKPKCTQPDSSKLTAAASAPTGKISPSVNAATPKLEEPPFAPVLPAIQLPSHKEPTSGTRSKSVPLPKPSADPRGSKCVEPDVVPRKAHSQQSTPDNRLSKSESLPQLHQPLAEACIHGSGFGVLSVC